MGKFKFPTNHRRFTTGSLLLIAEAWVRSGTFSLLCPFHGVCVARRCVVLGGAPVFRGVKLAFWNSHFQVVGAEMRPLACGAGSQSYSLTLPTLCSGYLKDASPSLSSVGPTGHSADAYFRVGVVSLWEQYSDGCV